MAKVRLEAELVDKVSGPADKAARAAEKLARAGQRAEAKQRNEAIKAVNHVARIRERHERTERRDVEKAARADAKAAAQADKVARAEAKAATKATQTQARVEAKAAAQAARTQARADKMRRADLINHARGIAKKDRLEKKAADKVMAERARNLEKWEAKHGTMSGAVASFVGNLAANAVGKIVDMGVAVAQLGVEYIGLNEKSKLAFSAVTNGDANAAASALANSDALAKKYGMDLFEARQQYRDLLDLDFKPKDVDTFIKLGQDLQATGESAESTAAMFKALSKIRVKGVLDSKTLMTLGEAGIQKAHWSSTIQAMGKALGVNGGKDDDIIKAIGKKGLSADKAIPLIQQALMAGIGEGTAGEMAAKRADTTLTGIFDKLKTRGQSMLTGAIDKLTPSLTKLATKFADFLESDKGQRFVDRLTDSLIRLVEGTDKLIDRLGGLDKIFNGLVDTLNFVLQPIVNLVQPFYDMFTNISGVLNDQSKSLYDKMYEIGGFAVKGLFKGIFAVATFGMGPVAVGLADQLYNSVKKSLGIASPSKVMAKLGVYSGEGFALGVSRTYGMAADAGAGTADSYLSGYNSQASAPSVQPTQNGTGGSVGGGPTTGSRGRMPNISITVQGNADENTVAEMKRMLRREVENMFRFAAQEVGA